MADPLIRGDMQALSGGQGRNKDGLAFTATTIPARVSHVSALPTFLLGPALSLCRPMHEARSRNLGLKADHASHKSSSITRPSPRLAEMRVERAEQGNSLAEQGEHMACGDFGSLLLSDLVSGLAAVREAWLTLSGRQNA